MSDELVRMKDEQRHLLGATFGGLFWGLFRLGTGGFWMRIALWGLPLKHDLEQGMFLGLCIGMLVGVVWGLLTAWPKRWWLGVLLGAAAFVSLFVVGILQYFLAWTLVEFFFAITCSGFIAGFGAFFAALLRLLLSKYELWRCKLGKKWGFLCSMTIVIAGGMVFSILPVLWSDFDTPTWSSLQKAHDYAQAQGWQDYTLEIASADSGTMYVHIYMPSGEVYECRDEYWSGIDIECELLRVEPSQ